MCALADLLFIEKVLDRAYVARTLEYLHQQGCAAVFVTCDTPNHGNREKTYRSSAWVAQLKDECGGFAPPRALEAAGVGEHAGHTATLCWDDILWIKGVIRTQLRSDMALVLKGVMTAEDVRRAVAVGVDAVAVSNHGGRQLDGTMGTIEVVAECVRAARGRCEVFVDGGFRRGKDIFKALALGANAVFVGRPALWGLAVAGQAGVEHALGILEAELKAVMQLSGCATVADICEAHLHDRVGPLRSTPSRL